MSRKWYQINQKRLYNWIGLRYGVVYKVVCRSPRESQTVGSSFSIKASGSNLCLLGDSNTVTVLYSICNHI